MGCGIDWCGFTWDAFSTLLAGGGAVGGALILGRQQIRITRRQTEIAFQQSQILAQQVKVDQVKLRADLFERRLKVYEAIKDYIRDALALRVDFEPNFPVWQNFARQIEQAQFLFAGTVQQHFHDAAAEADHLLNLREDLRELRSRYQTPDLDEQAEIDRQSQIVRTSQTKLRKMLSGLAKDMGAEMELFVSDV
jgi:hypothetical protein